MDLQPLVRHLLWGRIPILPTHSGRIGILPTHSGRIPILPTHSGRIPILPTHAGRIGILPHVINAGSDAAFPVCHPELCVFLQVTDGRGSGTVEIVAIESDTDQVIWSSIPQTITFGKDPLAVSGLVFRLRNCLFPRPGLYWIEFRYNDVTTAQEHLLLRGNP